MLNNSATLSHVYTHIVQHTRVFFLKYIFRNIYLHFSMGDFVINWWWIIDISTSNKWSYSFPYFPSTKWLCYIFEGRLFYKKNVKMWIMFRGIIFIQWFIGVSKNCIMPLFYHLFHVQVYFQTFISSDKNSFIKLPSCCRCWKMLNWIFFNQNKPMLVVCKILNVQNWILLKWNLSC